MAIRATRRAFQLVGAGRTTRARSDRSLRLPAGAPAPAPPASTPPTRARQGQRQKAKATAKDRSRQRQAPTRRRQLRQPPLPSPRSRDGSPDAIRIRHAGSPCRVPRAASRAGASPYDVAPRPPLDAPPQRRRPPLDETPFDPIGMQVGAFNFKPGDRIERRLRHQSGAHRRTPTPSLVFGRRAGAEVQFQLGAP